jgi:1-deoxy-D-xylulose-5-phosphate reductoisomerase
MKGIAVMGSTGSIGTQTLDIVTSHPDQFRVISLSAGRNFEMLVAQIERFRPLRVAFADPTRLDDLRRLFPNVDISADERSLTDCVIQPEVDIVVMGIVGFAALAPTLQAIRAGKTIALANKEALVVAGSLLRREISQSSAKVIPVDSEHNALFQLLEGRDRSHVSKLVLTASGGPLLRQTQLPLEDVTPAIAIKHPNWKMGPKISVDSATLMNKGLELIEAHFLFDTPENDIEVWVHPQSIVHGAIWLKDNSCLAQLSRPDMRLSIGFALKYPERLEAVIPRLSLRDMSQLEFLEPDVKRFPCLELARQALRLGPSHLIALNAANEVAVQRFLEGHILFPDIPGTIAKTLDRHTATRVEQIEDVFTIDRESRELAMRSASR